MKPSALTHEVDVATYALAEAAEAYLDAAPGGGIEALAWMRACREQRAAAVDALLTAQRRATITVRLSNRARSGWLTCDGCTAAFLPDREVS